MATQSSVLKFGVENVIVPTIGAVPCAIFDGVVCGLLGACFIYVNSNLALVRKRYVTKMW